MMMPEREPKSAAQPPVDAPTVQVKICGLTRPDEAAACAAAGAHAIGLVFYPRSRRCISTGTARDICRALPAGVARVGVFVDAPVEAIVRIAAAAGLTAVQLHGTEPPELVEGLRREGLFVIKALFAERAPTLEQAPIYPASAFLVECGRGPLPGGNAIDWEWGRAVSVAERFPTILAGGLTPMNAAQAICAASPDAVDASSGVEVAPGRKDINKVRAFIRAATAAPCRRRVFA
jgi:phosphoribosylanthranilate isomerase